MAELFITLFLVFSIMAAIGCLGEYIGAGKKKQKQNAAAARNIAQMSKEVPKNETCLLAHDGAKKYTHYKRSVFFENYFKEAC